MTLRLHRRMVRSVRGTATGEIPQGVFVGMRATYARPTLADVVESDVQDAFVSHLRTRA